MEFDERRVYVSGQGRGVNADRQEAKLAAASAFDAPEFRVHAIEDSRGARDDLLPHRGKAGAPPFVLSNKTTSSWRSTGEIRPASGRRHAGSPRRS
jgi:hypothetical protein